MIERDERGMTLAEVVISLAVMGLILPAIAGILYLATTVPLRGSNTIKTSLEADQTLEVISRDARSALTFAPGSSPDYGTFSWTDLTSVPPISDTVRYYYSPSDTSLIREETVSSTVTSRNLAQNILSYGDISFLPIGSSAVSIAITSTISTATAPTGVITRESTGLVMLRSALTPAASGVTFSASQDSYVDQNHADTNNGTSTTLQVQAGNGPTANRTFVQFNLSSIPSSATVISARLRLFPYQTNNSTRNYEAHRVTGSWTEAGITWNNQPGTAAGATDVEPTNDQVGVWMEWDVTADVAGFVSGSYTNYGWRIKDQTETSPASQITKFNSRENTGVAFDPQLVVNYSTAGPTPVPTATPVAVSLNSSSDSYVYMNKPNNNYGGSTALIVRSSSSGNPDTNDRTFVAFDVSSIPSGANISSAVLKLYMYNAPSASRNYDAYRITASWTENGITWNIQPAVAASPSSTVATGTGSNVWLQWDVTSDVQSFVNNAATNYGWRINDQVESSSSTREGDFRSREYSGTAYDPLLVVTYNP